MCNINSVARFIGGFVQNIGNEIAMFVIEKAKELKWRNVWIEK
jgi:hypothetical protein